MTPADPTPDRRVGTRIAAEQTPLAQMSLRALIAQLAALEDRIRSENATGGTAPGHTQRIASLTRRVRLIQTELAHRRTHQPHSHADRAEAIS
jgi:hypothetical protein